MKQMTAFEYALLEQFETLARASEIALDGSQETSSALRDLSERVNQRLDQFEKKQQEIEHFQRHLLKVLSGQSELAESLVEQVNTLLIGLKA